MRRKLAGLLALVNLIFCVIGGWLAVRVDEPRPTKVDHDLVVLIQAARTGNSEAVRSALDAVKRQAALGLVDPRLVALGDELAAKPRTTESRRFDPIESFALQELKRIGDSSDRSTEALLQDRQRAVWCLTVLAGINCLVFVWFRRASAPFAPLEPLGDFREPEVEGDRYAEHLRKAIRARFHIRELKSQLDLEKTTAEVDPLTRLLNRLGLERGLKRLLHASLNRDRVWFVMLDIDFFKAVNGEYGHPGGDVVISTLAEILRGTIRERRDLAARIGGEEFWLVLTGLEAEEFRAKLRDLMDRIRSARIEVVDTENRIRTVESSLLPGASITVSGGVAEIGESAHFAAATAFLRSVSADTTDERVFTDLIDDTYRIVAGRLKEAKESGRNRIVGIDPPDGLNVPSDLSTIHRIAG